MRALTALGVFFFSLRGPSGSPAGEEAPGGPSIFWASDPVSPGETVSVAGEGFGPEPKIEIVRIPDGPPGEPGAAGAPGAGPAEAVAATQPGPQSVKFAVPAGMRPGIFRFAITAGGRTATGLLNRPRLWWVQGDRGTGASPGGWIRAFGVDLAAPEKDAAAGSALHLAGPRSLVLPAAGDGYALRCALPADLPAGEYAVTAHNGRGAAAGWSEPARIRIAAPAAWPETVLDVKDFGAEGDGVKDDTDAVLAALEKARASGGGIVFFPRGRYSLSDALPVPRRTILRGERRERVALAWVALDPPPEALIRGTNSFGLEDLTIYANRYRHVIAGDLGDVPGSGDVRLRRIRVRANIYIGHLTPEQVDGRFRDALTLSTGGGDTVRLGGRNVEIVDCDLYGSGRVLFLGRARGGRVEGNRLSNGRWGWYCISGSDGLIFEDNELSGGDLMSTGGGLNCLDGSTASENVYYARNRLRLMHGWDREAMTSDAGGEAYFGKVASAEGTALALAKPPSWDGRDWAGAGVFILDGRGAGQHRRIVRHDGPKVEVDRPWTVPPDAASDVSITMFQGHYLLVDNEFTDTGAMQFFGTSIECLVARNRGARMSGFHAFGLWYYGYQPSWYCQFIGNEILEGNYYHWESADEALLEVGGARRDPYAGPLNRGAVVRRNVLAGGAHIRVAGRCRDVVVEGNRVADADQGVFVSREAEGVLVKGNAFSGVAMEVADEEAIRRAGGERMRRFLGRREPVAAWSFEDLVRGKFEDGSGNRFPAKPQGGAAQVAEGKRGKAVRLDGKVYLRVDERAAFNVPDITVSFWMKPATLSGRRGLIAKRFAGGLAPFVISQVGAALAFDASEENGIWTFNFQSPPVLAENKWTHVAAVARRGSGVALYVDGREVARRDDAADRAMNGEPLIIGREAWGGDPPAGDTPGFFIGLIDEVKVWARSLSAEEVRDEFRRG